nr:MFS transporter [Desulfobulbaceae bacterium]
MSSKDVKTSVWAFSTYFAEGFPYTIIRTISSFYFRAQGMSLEGLGVTSVFGLPWVLKFLWGPLVDTFGTKRKWLLLTESLLCCLFVLTAFLTPLNQAVPFIAVLFFAGSFLAATHDIAIDGFYMEALNLEEQAKFLGYRVMAYRIAMMTGTGVVSTVGAVYNWTLAFCLAATIMIALLILNNFLLPKTEIESKALKIPSAQFIKTHSFKIIVIALLIISLRAFSNSAFYTDLQQDHLFLKKLSFPVLISLTLFLGLFIVWLLRRRLHKFITDNPESFYARSFHSFIDRDKIGTILGFIICIRSGEYMLSTMYSPFIVDLGLKTHYGWISAGIGLPCSIVGAIIGGWCIAKYSLKKMIWPFLFLQNVTNLIYMLLALKLSALVTANTGGEITQIVTSEQIAAVATVHAFDQFSGGLGTAVLMTFLMRICLPEFKASHYAIGTGLMSISGLYAGVVSGFLTSWVGYGYFFGISFLISVPGMFLAALIPHHSLGVRGKG